MPRSPLRDGWRVLMRAPFVVIAEIAWRWTFGLGAAAILYYGFREYFATVTISRAEYYGLRAFQPATWMMIVARIVVAVEMGLHAIGPIIVPAIFILWVALATLGRAASVRALTRDDPRTNWFASVGLSGFRALLACAAVLAFFGAGFLVNAIVGDPTQRFAEAVLLMLFFMVAIGAAWLVANWFFSLAPIFAAADGRGFWSSLGEAGRLYRAEQDGFISTGFWFAFARGVLVVLSTVLSLWAFTQARPHVAVALIIFISLAYFACADALTMWRLACYISFTEPAPEPPVMAAPPAVIVPSPIVEPAVPSQERSQTSPENETPATSDEPTELKTDS